MGVVYRAYHVPLARTGAVKVMHGISPDPDSIARFRREAQAIAQMRHPNILNVFDYGEYQGTPYMIVEFVPGGSLAAQMKKGPLDTATALEYWRESRPASITRTRSASSTETSSRRTYSSLVTELPSSPTSAWSSYCSRRRSTR